MSDQIMKLDKNGNMIRTNCLDSYEEVPIKGNLVMDLYNPDGTLKKHYDFGWNTITDLHDILVADRLAGGADSLIGFTGIGTTSGGKTTASTALEAQVDRNANDSDTQTGATNDVVHIATFAAGEGTGALLEAGLFTDAGAGATLQAYQEFAVVNKAAGDSLVTTWTITYGAS